MILLLLLLTLLFPSCDNALPLEREVYLVTVADDFYGYNGSPKKLKSVINDQAALISQFQTLGDIHVMAFISQDGERWTSRKPHFVPCDKLDEEITDSESSSFTHFRFKDAPGDEAWDWTMKDVLSFLEDLPAQADDLVVFTYSGHGEKDSGSLLTNASRTSDLYEQMGVGNILDTLEAMGGNKILFIDACYSGFFVPETRIFPHDSFSDSGRKELQSSSPLNALKAVAKGAATSTARDRLWVMSAASTGQEALDSLDAIDSPYQKYYGAFTYYLLEALGYDMCRNAARQKKGRISFYGLYSYIREHFPEEELIYQTPQVSRKLLDVMLN